MTIPLAIAAAEPHPLIMLPFAGMLLCIALLPFILKHHWEQNYHLVATPLAAITIGYYVVVLRNPAPILHEAQDYISFMALVGSLFVVAGGIHIAISGAAKPIANCAFLLIGGLLANVVGTTGASMLLIRPWIRANKYRYTGVHTAFFIFIVSNVGGAASCRWDFCRPRAKASRSGGCCNVEGRPRTVMKAVRDTAVGVAPR